MDRIKQYEKLVKIRNKLSVPDIPFNTSHPLKIIFNLNELTLYYNPESRAYVRSITGGGGQIHVLEQEEVIL